MSVSWSMWDRIRAAAKAHRLFQQDRTVQDQPNLNTLGRDLGMNGLDRQQLSTDSLFSIQTNRFARYRDYEMMDHGELALALDIYGLESTIIDPERKRGLIIKAKRSAVKKELEDLFFNTLNWDSVAFTTSRYLCKFGDNPFEIIPTVDRDGVAALKHIEVREFNRLETKSGDLIGFFYNSESKSEQPVFMHPWRVAHMRLDCLEKDFKPYGMSIIDRSRTDAKRVRLTAEAAIIYRLTRATEKRKIMVPVGNISAKEIPEYLNIVARGLKRKRIYDPRTGQFDERYSPIIQEDDFVLPVRPDGSGINIETLPAGMNLDKIDDLEFFKKQMVAPTNIPPAMLGIGAGAGEPTKEPLHAVSYHFARSVQRVQRAITMGLKKVAIVHLLLRGYSIDDIKNFEISLPIVSAIEELYRMEAWQTRTAVMHDLKDLEWFPKEWIVTHFTDLTPDEIVELNELIEQMGADPNLLAGGEGGGGGSLGGLGAPPSGQDDSLDGLDDKEPDTPEGAVMDRNAEEALAGGPQGGAGVPEDAAGLSESVNRMESSRRRKAALCVLEGWYARRREADEPWLSSQYGYMLAGGEFRLLNEQLPPSLASGSTGLILEAKNQIAHLGGGYREADLKVVRECLRLMAEDEDGPEVKEESLKLLLEASTPDLLAGQLNQMVDGDRLVVRKNVK
jgi:hypothetical protein